MRAAGLRALRRGLQASPLGGLSSRPGPALQLVGGKTAAHPGPAAGLADSAGPAAASWHGRSLHRGQGEGKWQGQGHEGGQLAAQVASPCVGRGLALGARGFSVAPGELGRSDALKRLLFRSKQRGILELDLLVGNWAEKHMPSLSDAQLDDLAQLLDQESPDLLKWLLGQASPPDAIVRNEAFQGIRAQVLQRLQKHANPDTKASPGLEWVRGWGDIGGTAPRAAGLPPAGNQ